MIGIFPKTVPGKAVTDKAKVKPSPSPKALRPRRGFLSEDTIAPDIVANEQVELDHYHRLFSKIFWQTVVIGILGSALVLFAPFFKPVYFYYARTPDDKVMALNELTMPNMTNRAVLSWAVASVTEIMTIGFGDLVPHLEQQKPRFTGDGWNSFVAAFQKQKINEKFKENQLVLTAVPSNTPVILTQGPNENDVYQWKVQLPVIMTYATNDSKTQSNPAVVTLTITRVPVGQNSSGIAIKKWVQEG